MIKRYFLVLAPADDEQSTSRIVQWVHSQRVALASNCTLLTSKDVSRSLRAIEEEGENEEKDLQEYGGLEQTTVSKFDIEILGPISANPLDCVHLPWGEDVEGGDDEEDESNNKSGNTNDLFKVDKLTDLLAVSRVLLSPQDFVGVAYFSDTRSLNTISQTSITNLQRICTQCNIPFATNEVTATLCLQASTKNRRMAVLLFNPVAGQRPAATDLKEIYSLLGHAFNIKVVYTEKDIDVAEQAAGVVEWIHGHKQKFLATVGNVDEYVQPLLIASGGDGTVSAIAGATIDSGITVGVIPRGTCNAFSVALGIPTDVAGACRNILLGQERGIDGATVTIPIASSNAEGDVSDSPGTKTIAWINHAGLGFEAGLVDNTTRELKDTFGNFGYTIGAAKQLLTQQPFECTFQIDDDPSSERTINTSILTVGNVDPPSSIFAQGFGAVIPDDGLFEVTIGTADNAIASLEGLAALAINTVIKNSVGSDKLTCLRCRKIKVSCSPAQKMLLDGEVVEVDEHPVVFECKPKALNVVVPLAGGVNDEVR